MEECKNAAQGGADAQRLASPTPVSHRGEASDTGEAVQDLRDDVDSMEEEVSQIGASPKMPFRFTQSRQSPSEQSLMSEHQQDHPILEDQVHYCVHVRVTLGEWGGNQPLPCHAWSSLLIVDMLQEGLKEQITEAVIVALGKEGLSLESARDVGFSLTGLTSWASRAAQVEATICTVQEGHHAIAEAVVEKRTKARGPGHPCGMMKVTKTPTTACNIEEWMQVVEEDVPEKEVRKGSVAKHRLEQMNVHSQQTSWGSRWHQRQGRPRVPMGTSDGSASSWGGSSYQGSNWSTWHSTIFRVSGECLLTSMARKRSEGKGQCANLQGWEDHRCNDLPFMAVGHSHFPPLRMGLSTSVAIWYLEGFPGDLARGLGEDATLLDIFQTFDKHYSVVMTFGALSKEIYSLKQEPGENVAEFWVQLSQQVQILQFEYPGRIQQEHMKEMKRDHFSEGLNPKYQQMLVHNVDGEHPTRYSDLLLAAWKLERWAEAIDLLLTKTTSMGRSNVTHSQTVGNLFPFQKLKDSHNFMARLAMVESNGVAEDSGTKG